MYGRDPGGHDADCPPGCDGSGLGPRGRALATLFILGILAASTAGAVYGYAAGYGIVVMAVLAVAAVLLYIAIGYAAPLWILPALMLGCVAVVWLVDVALGSPIGGGGLPW